MSARFYRGFLIVLLLGWGGEWLWGAAWTQACVWIMLGLAGLCLLVAWEASA